LREPLANKELPKGLLPFSRTIKGQKVLLSCLSMGKPNWPVDRGRASNSCIFPY